MALLLVAVACTACIGTTSRERFTEEVQERGGGLSNELARDAMAAIADELGVGDPGDVEVRSLTILPGTLAVDAEVRDPDAPDNLDAFVVVNGDVESVEPVQLSADVSLEAVVFRLGELPLDRLETLADEALAAFDQAGSYVESVSAGGPLQQGVGLEMSLQSPRAQATASFGLDGDLLEVTRL